MSLKLSNFTAPELVFARMDVDSREACLRLLVERLVELGKTEHGDLLLQELLERERVETTGIGGGIAIPHARSEAITNSLVMIATLARPLPFNSVDGEPVDLVFLLAGSRDLRGQQLRVLARISQLVRIDQFLADLRAAETPAEILGAVRSTEASHF